MLQAKGSTILLLFSLLEYAVHKASYKRSKFPHFSISSNINLRQNGAKMYSSRDVTFISVLMNSFVLYVKRSIPIYTCVWEGTKNMAAVMQHIANKGPFNVLSASFAAIQVAWRLNKVCLLPSKLKIMV